MKHLAAILGKVLAILLLVWFLAANTLFLQKVFFPLQEQVRRETFEQSKSFVSGNVAEIRNMQLQFVQSSKEQQTALVPIIIRRIDNIPENNIPEDLRIFKNTLLENY